MHSVHLTSQKSLHDDIIWLSQHIEGSDHIEQPWVVLSVQTKLLGCDGWISVCTQPVEDISWTFTQLFGDFQTDKSKSNIHFKETVSHVAKSNRKKNKKTQN